MKRVIFPVLVLFGVAVAGCDMLPWLPSGSSDAGTEAIIMADPADFDREDWPDGFYDVEEAEITGDILRLQVTYSGCREHDFDLVAWNYFMESHPVQAYALLAHDREPCDMVLSAELRFDLTPLKDEYQRQYGTSGVIDLSLRDRGETYTTLRYAFGE